MKRSFVALTLVYLAAFVPSGLGCAGKKTHMHAESVSASGVRVSPSDVYSNGSVLVVKLNVLNQGDSAVVLDEDAARLTLPDGRILSPSSHAKAKNLERGAELVRIDFRSEGFKWKEIPRAQLDLSSALLVNGSPAHLAAIELTLDAKGPPLAQIQEKQITISEQIQFKTDSAEILADSEPIVEAVAEILTSTPKIAKLRIEGHTDATGNPAANLELSKRRAAAVVAALVAKGVSKDRLVSQGFGDTKPIDSNSTEEGKQKNRRVEFHIL
jgi:outer membrane protein OmpA-like peptidoglycan-associated protein